MVIGSVATTGMLAKWGIGVPHYRITINAQGEDIPDPTVDYAAQVTRDAATASFAYAFTDDTNYEIRIYAVSAYGQVSEAATALFIRTTGGGTTTDVVPPIPRDIYCRQYNATTIEIVWTCQPVAGSEPDSFKLYLASDLTTVLSTTNYVAGQFRYRATYTPSEDGLYSFRLTSVNGSFASHVSRIARCRFDSTAPSDPDATLTAEQESE